MRQWDRFHWTEKNMDLYLYTWTCMLGLRLRTSGSLGLFQWPICSSVAWRPTTGVVSRQVKLMKTIKFFADFPQIHWFLEQLRIVVHNDRGLTLIGFCYRMIETEVFKEGDVVFCIEIACNDVCDITIWHSPYSSKSHCVRGRFLTAQHISL